LNQNGGHLQNYPRTDKKKEGEQKIQYTFELID
jgi:hypothetical protein